MFDPTMSHHITDTWFRVLLSIISFAILLPFERKDDNQKIRKNIFILKITTLFLIIKDAAYLLTDMTVILPFSDAIYMPLYGMVLFTWFKKHLMDTLYIIAGGAATTVILFYNSSMVKTPSYELFLYAGFGGIAYTTLRFFMEGKQRDSFLLKIHIPVAAALSAYYTAIYFIGYRSHVVSHLIVTLINIIHAYVIFQQMINEKKEINGIIEVLEEEKATSYSFLENIGQVMMEKEDLDEINEYLISTIQSKTGAESAAILLFSEKKDCLYISAKIGDFIIPGVVDESVKSNLERLREVFARFSEVPGETPLDKAYRKKETVFIEDLFKIRHDTQYRENTGNNLAFISSIIMVPLNMKEKIIGLVCIQQNMPGKRFSYKEFQIVSSLSVYAEIMITNISVHREILEKRELDRDIRLSSGIQQSLLPSDIPTSEHFSFSVHSKPARHVSGDYHDFIEFDSGKVGFLICDVAGKGMAAGLVMTAIRTAFHLIAGDSLGTSTVMKYLNRSIRDIGGGHFATAMYLIYDPQTGKLAFSNAAHIPGAIFRSSSSSIEYIDAEGLPLGIEKTTSFEESSTFLHTGDLLLLYTDGVNETMNNEKQQVGKDTIIEMVYNNRHLPVNEISDGITGLLESFREGAPLHDDRTLVVFKRA